MAGLIHIYCGDGKGKTTAAMGLALRSAGSGRKVMILQFIKDGTSSELTPLRALESVEVIPQTRRFGFSWTLSAEEKAEAKAYYTGLLEDAAKRCGDRDLLVLDEAVGAVNADMLDQEKLLAFLDSKPENLEVVLTGREPTEAIQARADYITEMKKIRHPMDRGVGARKGVEF